MTEIRDILGVRIDVGDMVAWPQRWSSSLWMIYGKVTAITHKDGIHRISIVDNKGDGRWTEQIDRVVVAWPEGGCHSED